MKIVSDTPEPVIRQRRLEENIRGRFALAASSVLAFIAGQQSPEDIVKRMREFVAAHDKAEQESIDPKGVPIITPDLSRRESGELDPDKPINTILRGALLMVSAMLLHQPATGTDDYKNGRNELAEGIMLLNAEIKKTKTKLES